MISDCFRELTQCPALSGLVMSTAGFVSVVAFGRADGRSFLTYTNLESSDAMYKKLPPSHPHGCLGGPQQLIHPASSKAEFCSGAAPSRVRVLLKPNAFLPALPALPASSRWGCGSSGQR